MSEVKELQRQLDAAEADLADREQRALRGEPTAEELRGFAVERDRLARDREGLADAGIDSRERGISPGWVATSADRSATEPAAPVPIRTMLPSTDCWPGGIVTPPPEIVVTPSTTGNEPTGHGAPPRMTGNGRRPTGTPPQKSRTTPDMS